MISRITGKLESLDTAKATISPDGALSYDVLLPSFVVARLGNLVGQTVTLHTLHFLEGTSQGTTFTPRLAGFMSTTDRAFFELFTTVKGIGSRKALRCLAMDVHQIAGAIVERDLKLLQSLPEIGRKMAETIVTALHDKVEAYAAGAVSAGAAGETTSDTPADTESTASRTVARDALEVLAHLGENRADAVQWINRVLTDQPDIAEPQELIAEVFRIRGAS
ncbi:MAG: hypothetical protein CMJ49_10325 [Planctomycetaceae bacterium]|nr:hypothetical protein [Planctomycetaceae bacterium]